MKKALRNYILKELQEIADSDGDIELNHLRADKLLLDLIDDDEIRKVFDDIEKWYA